MLSGLILGFKKMNRSGGRGWTRGVVPAAQRRLGTSLSACYESKTNIKS